MVLLSGTPCRAAEPDPGLLRLRTESARVRHAIAKGLEDSSAFVRLHQALDGTDGLVYIVEGDCGPGLRACLHLSMHSGPGFRLLRIVVSPRLVSGCAMTASVGHELQHALEVLAEPGVRASADMYYFFYRISITKLGVFETQAAIDAGDAVRKQACAPRGDQVSRWARTSGSANRQITLSMK